MLNKDKIAKKYLPLIRWASRRASEKYSKSQFDYQDFFDGGLEALSICLAKHSDLPEEEFGKYFKTSLFHKLRQIQIKAFSKKYYGLKTSFESLTNASSLEDQTLIIKSSLDSYFEQEESFVKQAVIEEGKIVGWEVKTTEIKKEPSFQFLNPTKNYRNPLEEEIEFNRLVKSVKTFLTPLERKIFELYVDPPEKFLDTLIFENRRKYHYWLCTNVTKKGTHKLVLKTEHIFSYLEKEDGITRSHFVKSLATMREKISYFVKLGITRIPKSYDVEYGLIK